jgi:hypothetical protein
VATKVACPWIKRRPWIKRQQVTCVAARFWHNHAEA